MYDLKDIFNPAANPYKYLASPIFNIPGITTNHKLVLVAVGTFDEKKFISQKRL